MDPKHMEKTTRKTAGTAENSAHKKLPKVVFRLK